MELTKDNTYRTDNEIVLYGIMYDKVGELQVPANDETFGVECLTFYKIEEQNYDYKDYQDLLELLEQLNKNGLLHAALSDLLELQPMKWSTEAYWKREEIFYWNDMLITSRVISYNV